MALKMSRSNGLSNEAIYREDWADYVDSTISRHQSSGAPGVGDPIDLRDVMRLEELLSKIEHATAAAAAAACERGGRALGTRTSTQLMLEQQQERENKDPAACKGDSSRHDGVRPRERERKPLNNISSLPPLCQSPGASSLGSQCPASGPGAQDDKPFDLSRLGSEDERQQEVNPAASSAGSSDRDTAVAAKEDAENVKPAAGKQDERGAGTSEPNLEPGKVAAVVCLFESLAESMKGRRDEKSEGLSHENFQNLSDRDERSTKSEKPRYPASPVVPGLERGADPECSPRLVPPDFGLDSRVSHDNLSPSLQTMCDAGALQADRSLNGGDCTARMARCEGHTIVVEESSEQGGKEERRSTGEAHGVESVLAGVLSPSAQLDVTCIEAEEEAAINSPEERLPSALSQDCLGLLDGTVLDVRQGGSRGDLSGVGMTAADVETASTAAADGEGTLLCFAGQDLSLLEPSGNDSSNTADELAPFDLTIDQPSLEREQNVSAGGSQSPRSEGFPDADGDGGNNSIDSILRDPRMSGSLSPVRDSSMVSAASTYSGAFDRGVGCSPRDGSLEGEDRPLSEGHVGEHGVESPDIVLRGSVSPGSDNRPRGPASDRGSWGKDALGRRCRADGRDGGLGFAMQQSQDSHFGDRTFGSTLSPAIGGFGIDAADALSPLLAQPLFVDDLDGVENENFSDGGLSPGVSASSDSTVEQDLALPSRQEQSMVLLNEESEELHPRTPSLSRLSDPEGLFTTTPMGQRAGGVRPKHSVSPASSLRQPLALRRKEQRHKLSVQQPMTPERHPVVPHSRTELRDNRTPPGRYGSISPATSGGIVAEDLRGESFLDTAQSLDGDNSHHGEQVSIGSFSESDIGDDSFRDERRGGGDGYEGGADVSLVEGTPRQRGVGSGETMSGFYAPLPVANRAKAPKDASLSTIQQSTLEWMTWRESGDSGEGQRGEGTGAAGRLDNTLSGGMLGHLSSEEAPTCVLALIQQEAENTPGGKSDRHERLQVGTGLPRGTNLVIAPTKDAAEVWSSRLGSGAGLSVLNYVMPLKERRRLSAKQVAAFQVVVTTYDILKAKEVPRVVDPSVTSPTPCARSSNKWNTRNTPARKRAASRPDHMVSLLHGVWWHRIVADGAQLLANQRSARATAALGLVGRARWCVIEREGMATVESASERMRSLAAFLRVPDVMPLVEAAGCLFYHSRPSHVAPIPCRGPGPDTSLTEDGSPGSRRLTRDTEMKRGARHPRALTSKLTTDGNGHRGSMLERGGRSDKAGVGGPVEGCCGRDGGGGVGAGLSRGDVTYTATTLRFRKAQSAKSREMGPRRQER